LIDRFTEAVSRLGHPVLLDDSLSWAYPVGYFLVNHQPPTLECDDIFYTGKHFSKIESSGELTALDAKKNMVE
jgi:hypothetical protein